MQKKKLVNGEFNIVQNCSSAVEFISGLELHESLRSKKQLYK